MHMPSFLQHLAWGPLRLSMRIFCSLEIKGIENINCLKRNAIIASNHISELDPLLIVACLPFLSRHMPLFFVSREKDFYGSGWRHFVYGGRFFRLMGAYPAYVGLKNYEQALRHHLRLIHEKKDIVIFPMGKIALRGEPAEAKGGATFLARQTKLPIVPVLIQGIEHISISDFLLRKRKLTITFGKPLNVEDVFQDIDNSVIEDERNDYEKATSVLMEKVAQLA